MPRFQTPSGPSNRVRDGSQSSASFFNKPLEMSDGPHTCRVPQFTRPLLLPPPPPPTPKPLQLIYAAVVVATPTTQASSPSSPSSSSSLPTLSSLKTQKTKACVFSRLNSCRITFPSCRLVGRRPNHVGVQSEGGVGESGENPLI